MKSTIILSLFALWSIISPLTAQERDSTISVTSSNLYISGGQLIVSMQLQVNRPLRSNESVLLTPKLADSLDNFVQFPPIYVNGRRQHYVFLREEAKKLRDYVELRRRNKKEQSIEYLRAVRFSEWMRYARLEVEETSCGCGIPFQHDSLQLGYVEVPPQPVPVQQLLKAKVAKPVVVKNIIKKTGNAYLDFPLDESVIYPEFGKNTEELQKIHESLAQILGDSLLVLRGIELHGYASPEGPYRNNERLSYERTMSLKKYLMEKYALDESVIQVSNTVEDWEGFVRMLQISDIEHKPEILDIVNEEMEPDKKERKLRNKYPTAFKRMLKDILPALRRTEYTIHYSILPE